MRQIAQIDKDITANEKALRKVTKVRDRLSCADWQAAWDANPPLKAREEALYLERGEAQLARDLAAWAAAKKAAWTSLRGNKYSGRA